MGSKHQGSLTIDEPDRKRDKPEIHSAVIDTLRGIFDPEIPVNIYDLGLIYKIDVDDDSKVRVEMTLTTPGCPVAQTFPGTVEDAIAGIPGVTSAEVELVWDPPWSTDLLTDEIKLQLGIL